MEEHDRGPEVNSVLRDRELPTWVQREECECQWQRAESPHPWLSWCVMPHHLLSGHILAFWKALDGFYLVFDYASSVCVWM